LDNGQRRAVGARPSDQRAAAEYDDSHLRRLRVVRALIQNGRVPVATAREVLHPIDDDSLGRTIRMGAALRALPQVPEPDEEDEYVRGARGEVEQLLERLGSSNAQSLSTMSPAYRSLVVGLAAFRRLGYAWPVQLTLPYAQLMHQVAVLDLDFMETHQSEEQKVEVAVLGTALLEPVLAALRRVAQEEESARRYGFE
jgi:hypothetical protein